MMTAVVADDDPEVRAITTEYLGLRGFEVTQAANGLEALSSVRHVRPDVLVLGGVGDVDLARRALSYGACDYVTKPVDLSYLQRSIEAAVSTTG
jgi:CheY-like chemotaxis protein